MLHLDLLDSLCKFNVVRNAWKSRGHLGKTWLFIWGIGNCCVLSPHHRRGTYFVQSLWLKFFWADIWTIPCAQLKDETCPHTQSSASSCPQCNLHLCCSSLHPAQPMNHPFVWASGGLALSYFCSHNQLCASLAGWFVSVRMGKAFSGKFQTSFSLKSLIPISILERYITVFEVVSVP